MGWEKIFGSKIFWVFYECFKVVCLYASHHSFLSIKRTCSRIEKFLPITYNLHRGQGPFLVSVGHLGCVQDLTLAQWLEAVSGCSLYRYTGIANLSSSWKYISRSWTVKPSTQQPGQVYSKLSFHPLVLILMYNSHRRNPKTNSAWIYCL